MKFWKTEPDREVRWCSVTRLCPTMQPHGLQYTRLPWLTISPSLFKFMSTESMTPSNHLFLCCPLLLPPSIFPSIRVFSNESVLLIRWPKYWSFSFSISPSNEYSDWFPLELTGLISLLSKGLSRVFSSTTAQKHQFFIDKVATKPSLWSNTHIYTWLMEKP